jgi:hypothetical protein
MALDEEPHSAAGTTAAAGVTAGRWLQQQPQPLLTPYQLPAAAEGMDTTEAQPKLRPMDLGVQKQSM